MMDDRKNTVLTWETMLVQYLFLFYHLFFSFLILLANIMLLKITPTPIHAVAGMSVLKLNSSRISAVSKNNPHRSIISIMVYKTFIFPDVGALFDILITAFQLSSENSSVLVKDNNIDKVSYDDADHCRNICIERKCDIENI